MTIRTTIALAGIMALLASANANAMPRLAMAGAMETQSGVETVQFRGGNWRDHPLMYGSYWREHQRQWDAFEGRGAYGNSTPCARFRSYDPASQTYVRRDGRRVRCR